MHHLLESYRINATWLIRSYKFFHYSIIFPHFVAIPGYVREVLPPNITPLAPLSKTFEMLRDGQVHIFRTQLFETEMHG